MNASKLIKRLRREAKASPKKAAALGLLLLVAGYYWMPLLKAVVTKADAAGRKPRESAEADFTAMIPSGEGSAAEGKATPTYGWERLAEWIDEDALTRPAESLVTRRSPFEPVVAEIALAETDQEMEQPARKSPTPESLGMALSGTVVGPGRRVAVIDGKAYPEGRSVEARQSGDVIQFKLSEVHPERIVLERLGEQFELAIPRRSSSPLIEAIEN